ncbi:hypothetical protein [Arsenophonus sp.]|uniref:hypothetical protein n=1 Tax=Arsenophonus sp. TaxID=1872640 RepID=UPI00387A08E0
MSKAMTSIELEKIHAEISKMMAETIKLNSEANKLNSETAKLNRETFWYPVAVASGIVGAVAAITTVIIKLV